MMPAPIGHKLKAARESRGLSLLDAAYATRIPVARLQMLEQDNYAAFGSMTYARSFLKAYSQFLKVSAHEMLEELPGGVLGGARDYRYLTENHGSWVAPRNQRVGRLASPPPYRNSRRSPVPTGIFIFVMMLIGTGIWGKWVSDDRIARDQSHLPEQEKSADTKIPTQPVAVTHAVDVQTNAQVQTVQQTQILKALPLTSDEEVQRLTNMTGKDAQAN